MLVWTSDPVGFQLAKLLILLTAAHLAGTTLQIAYSRQHLPNARRAR